MKRPLAAALCLALLVVAAACGGDSGDDARSNPTGDVASGGMQPGGAPATQPPATGGAPAASPTPPGPATHEGALALKHVEKLSKEIGPRVSGTQAEKTATEYIAAQFRGSGYEVELMEFSFEGNRFANATVTVAGGAPIDGLTLAGSDAGSVSAEVVYVRLADAAGIGGRSLAGKIALADRGTLRFGEKYDNVKTAGAIALIIMNNQPGGFSGTLGKDAKELVVAVPQEAGTELQAAAAANKKVTIEVKLEGEARAVNVIARAPGTQACSVLVGGHHDTVPDAPGANDNASGSANVIELARAFAADGLDKGLCFATFGAEESGLFGSKALAERMQAENELPRYMVNLDVTGVGKGVEVIGQNELKQRAIRIAEGLGIEATPSSLPANSGSDHQSFNSVGVPVVFFTSGDFSTIHSPQDIFGDISADVLDKVGDVAYALIADLLKDG